MFRGTVKPLLPLYHDVVLKMSIHHHSVDKYKAHFEWVCEKITLSADEANEIKYGNSLLKREIAGIEVVAMACVQKDKEENHWSFTTNPFLQLLFNNNYAFYDCYILFCDNEKDNMSVDEKCDKIKQELIKLGADNDCFKF